jgi:hypothetical protein
VLLERHVAHEEELERDHAQRRGSADDQARATGQHA